MASNRYFDLRLAVRPLDRTFSLTRASTYEIYPWSKYLQWIAAYLQDAMMSYLENQSGVNRSDEPVLREDDSMWLAIFINAPRRHVTQRKRIYGAVCRKGRMLNCRFLRTFPIVLENRWVS